MSRLPSDGNPLPNYEYKSDFTRAESYDDDATILKAFP